MVRGVQAWIHALTLMLEKVPKEDDDPIRAALEKKRAAADAARAKKGAKPAKKGRGGDEDDPEDEEKSGGEGVCGPDCVCCRDCVVRDPRARVLTAMRSRRAAPRRAAPCAAPLQRSGPQAAQEG